MAYLRCQNKAMANVCERSYDVKLGPGCKMPVLLAGEAVGEFT